ncbi:MAG: nitroreductase [Magnetococcales bacterium]|nr:nitroreductase [Magnetococcales bacterium]
MNVTDDPGQRVLAYHEHSKHRPDRYAPGPGHLDWANQPEPFRTYVGAKCLSLPLQAERLEVLFAELYRPLGTIPAAEVNLASLGVLLELSLGLSAWKVYGESRWALRCNPSSGNLHPTEGYVVVPTLPASGRDGGVEAGVYHYVSRDHRLEQRRVMPGGEAEAWDRLFPPGQFLFGLTSIHWRESWKYGDRAFRYCQLDVGHALSAIRHAAAGLGWQVRLLTAPATRDVVRLLGLATGGVRFGGGDGEPEHGELLLQVGRAESGGVSMSPRVAGLAEMAGQGPWMGQANRLSRRHGMEWPLVEEMAELTRQPWQAEMAVSASPPLPPMLVGESGDVRAATLIRQRRSGQAFDARAWLESRELWRILDATLPRSGCAPWDLLPWRPRVMPVVMIHRVRGVESGLYLLLRDPERLEGLWGALDGNFLWSRVSDCPEHLPFYLLRPGNCQESAYWISCQQEIASDGVLSLGMLTAFPAEFPAWPWIYRQLYWEAGMVGHTLYLEAERAGMRGTGIGCFLDDMFYHLLGLRSERFQTLYHFTLGSPLADTRLTTEPPYSSSAAP